MEQKEAGAAEKAEKLVSLYEKSFALVQPTFHPPGLPLEIAGKSSNVAFAARCIGQVHRAELGSESCNVIITVMDGECCHAYMDPFANMPSRYKPSAGLL